MQVCVGGGWRVAGRVCWKLGCWWCSGIRSAGGVGEWDTLNEVIGMGLRVHPCGVGLEMRG